jgi:hypothetical protein
MRTKIILLGILTTLGFIAFGVVVGISACASVQGMDTCLSGFIRSIANIF